MHLRMSPVVFHTLLRTFHGGIKFIHFHAYLIRSFLMVRILLSRTQSAAGLPPFLTPWSCITLLNGLSQG